MKGVRATTSGTRRRCLRLPEGGVPASREEVALLDDLRPPPPPPPPKRPRAPVGLGCRPMTQEVTAREPPRQPSPPGAAAAPSPREARAGRPRMVTCASRSPREGALLTRTARAAAAAAPVLEALHLGVARASVRERSARTAWRSATARSPPAPDPSTASSSAPAPKRPPPGAATLPAGPASREATAAACPREITSSRKTASVSGMVVPVSAGTVSMWVETGMVVQW